MNWDCFDRFDGINEKYLPARGEGETMASQICTAINKLIYKWYNDGDVYDNTYNLEGWANDLSSYANWLLKYANAEMLLNIEFVQDVDEYERLLMALASWLLTDECMDEFSTIPKQGSIYNCEGPFKYEDQY